MKKTLPQPAALRSQRQANAQKIARYRRRKKNGLAVFKVEAVEADIVRVLRLRGLPENHDRQQVEKKLGELLTEIAGRWRAANIM